MFNEQFAESPAKVQYLGTKSGGRVSENTVTLMKKVIRDGAFDPYVRYWCETIVMNVPDRDLWGEIDSIYNFIQQNTRYARDPFEREFIQTPKRVLKRIQVGEKPSLDCDCLTVLSLALAKSLGYNIAIRITGYKGDKNYSHVYGLVNIKGEWVTLDAVRKGKYLGWEGQGATKVKTFPVR